MSPIITNNIATGNHNGLVTHHQLQSIFPVSLSVKNTTNIIVNILELIIGTFGLELVSLATGNFFHLPILS
jgi:hypothetical protein